MFVNSHSKAPADGGNAAATCDGGHTFSLGPETFAFASVAIPVDPSSHRLTAAEEQIRRAIVAGHSNASIACARGTSTHTVANQIAAICRKTGTCSRRDLAVEEGHAVFRPAIALPSGLSAELRELALRTLGGPPLCDPWAAAVGARLHTADWIAVAHFRESARYCFVAWVRDSSPGAKAGLSSRERDVLALSTRGKTNKVIACELGLAPGTVGALLARASTKCRAALSAARTAPSHASPRDTAVVSRGV